YGGGYPQGPPPSYPQAPPGGYGGGYPQSPPGGYGGGYGVPGGYGAGGPSRQAYATFWPRVGGWVIDFLLVGIVSSIAAIPLRNANVARINFTVTTTTNGQTTVHHDHLSFLATVVEVVIVLLYTGLMVGSRRGQTVGMMAINARAVDAADGSPIGFWRAVARTAVQYLLAIVFFLPWVLDMVFPAWDARRQTLHDKMTRTVVVKPGATAETVWATRPGGWGPG
ncbi:MAG: RDD family protein, partial [Acidimicrobiales bacterium]